MREKIVRVAPMASGCRSLACDALRISDRAVEADYREAGGYAPKISRRSRISGAGRERRRR